MGNGLKFLEERETKKTKRDHNTGNKKKMDKFIEEHGVVDLDAHEMIQGDSSTGYGVNNNLRTIGSQKSYRQRMMDKRGPQPCACCDKEFIPDFKYMQTSQAQRDNGHGQFTIYCTACTQRGSEFRRIMKGLKGGLEEFNARTQELYGKTFLVKNRNLRTLFRELDNRIVLHRDYAHVELLIEKTIEQAYKDNEYYDIQKKTKEFKY